MGKDQRTYAIIGAAMEVHGQLGCGFLENVYQEALALEFEERKIPYKGQVDLPISYKGVMLTTFYRADFICFEAVVVEIKATTKLTGIEEAQVINYLKATGHQVGLLLNFGVGSLEHRRLALARPGNPTDFREGQ
ncbi:MAG: GxxExxY protein [Nitrospinota bacterium]|jgi:GxxExxY protein|nr:GxxExxY protein [Nitrospinota bacterium]HJM42102.1 GxxExxY protein [Nitrospinota bacterium]